MVFISPVHAVTLEAFTKVNDTSTRGRLSEIDRLSIFARGYTLVNLLTRFTL